MIITENMTIAGRDYIRAWSDKGVYIERDGALYIEAIDPIDSSREYSETEEPIVYEDEATTTDYQSALAEFGVKL